MTSKHFTCLLLATLVTASMGLQVATAVEEESTPVEEELNTVDEEYAPVDEELYVDRDTGELLDQAALEERFPSAHTCGRCHPQHFREWSVSPHAYTTFSPVFQAFNATLVKRTNGTLGDFCIRCHTMVGINLSEGIAMPASQRNPLTREGITCIVCHRQMQSNGVVSARQHLFTGSIFDPVDGPRGNAELKRVLASGDYPIATTEEERGQKIHTDARKFDQLVTSGFCGTCHDVNVPNNLRFESLFTDFKSSPAAAEGIRCQDCHMGKRMGLAAKSDEDFFYGPAAVVNGVPTKPRKLTFHMFPGPDYSIVHPGVFPHNAEAKQFASISEWFEFDFEAGWGTDEFEDNVDEDAVFPERWEDVDDRYEAREILDEQLALLAEADMARLELMQTALAPGGYEISRADESGIEFKVEVKNTINGHTVPSGFDSERLIYMRAVVTDADGNVVFQSGDLDPNGDLRNLHSLYVHNGELPLDKQLFSLQAKTKARLFRGGEREQITPVNFSPSSLPFVRPTARASILYARPRGARKHRHGIPPLDSRWAKYTVDASALTGRPPYTANIKLITAEFSVHLIHEVQEGGFDYGFSPRLLAHRVVNGYRDVDDTQYGGHQVVFERELVLEAGEGSFEPMAIQEYTRTRVDGFASEYGE